MTNPLVTVICLCYNHARFAEEAVRSVLGQTYQPVELILVDDASTDNSRQVIERIVSQYPHIRVLFQEQNTGHCRAFNRALTCAAGDFIIDLAADDRLLPNRIETGVRQLQQAGKQYGVHFSDARYIDEAGRFMYLHSQKYPHATIPSGDLYQALIRRYFICPPTLMFTRQLMDELGGYDEALSYEDFDFLIRASRQVYFRYTVEPLVEKRVLPDGKSKKQFEFFSRESATTLRVCEKIMAMNRSVAEQEALSGRILYEMKLNARLLNFGMVKKYFALWHRNRELRYLR